MRKTFLLSSDFLAMIFDAFMRKKKMKERKKKRNLVNCVLVIFFLQSNQLLVQEMHLKFVMWNSTTPEYLSRDLNAVTTLTCSFRRADEKTRDPNEDTVRPYFDDNIQTNVSFQLTKTAYIHCTIHAVNDKVVSFVRQRDLHILTIGKYTYTTDQRFAAYHLNDTIVWTLEIRDTRRTDTGVYECQVSSDPKMSLPIQLNIIVVEATIWEGPLLYVKSGSPVNLTCHVQDPMGTVFLFWYHNGRVLDEGQKRRRQIEVVTELGTTSTSRLYIAKATQEDSGNYSCQPSYSEPANITLQVLNGNVNSQNTKWKANPCYLNLKFVNALRSNGKSRTSAIILCRGMSLPSPSTKFSQHVNALTSASDKVRTEQMKAEYEEFITINYNKRDLCVAF
ncbi:uncharacterized protein CEXT_150721 [Caerostris extrusa]|uniref:Ig-like domain-containing protein n=1 Tax=Caerostris extrusa TaxID=172846 RepID=A0AAV4MQJ3_CAEEX|nr:uncharacterized protein CEXT_150721 [Caerostris extrusa]